ncbi:MAG: IS110 family transposase [Gemmataceae bacterium]|nr:IS110 family transposase [Gemmataceae bacterium]
MRAEEDLIGRLSLHIEEVMAPFAEAATRLTTIPGVSQQVAERVIAEIGPRMGQFPTSGHLASWAGLSPEKNESATRRMATTGCGPCWCKRRGQPVGAKTPTCRRNTGGWRNGAGRSGHRWRWDIRCW